jgi:type I restriction enzyme S subunit
MSEVKNVPDLRFSEFSDDWAKKSLSEVCKLKAGKFVAAKDIFDESSDELYPCYGGNGLRGYTKSSTHEGLFPLIGRQGALCGNIQLATGKFHATEHAITVAPSKGNTSLFLYYQLDRLHLNRFATGQAQPGLSVDVIDKVKANFCNEKEQQKIADFLSSVDKKIEQLTEKHRLLTQYKKGVMQQLFSQQIRFKDDQGNDYPEWEDVELGDLLDYRQPTKYLVSDTDYSDEYETPVLTAGKTFILGYTNEKVGIFEDDLPVIIFDDFTTANKFVNFPFKAKSSAMKMLAAKAGADIKYIFEAMQMIRFEVGGHERHWISKYSKIPVPCPCVDEQQKLANFLTEIDHKIDQARSILEQTKTFKKGLLQKMFV